MLTRRRFVTQTVTLILIPVAAACSNDDSMANNGSCDGAGATSSTDQGHSHFVCVAAADLMNPPSAGATYTTSSDGGHTHQIEVSAADLGTIAGGGTVMVTSTVVQTHSHTFLLSNPMAAQRRTSSRRLAAREPRPGRASG